MGSQSYKCFSSTSPTSPKTESPGRRAKCYQEAPPPSTSSRSTRWTSPLTSSSYHHQVAPLCCPGNNDTANISYPAMRLKRESSFPRHSSQLALKLAQIHARLLCSGQDQSRFWSIMECVHVTHAVFVLPVCVCSTKPEKRPHSHRFGR